MKILLTKQSMFSLRYLISPIILMNIVLGYALYYLDQYSLVWAALYSCFAAIAALTYVLSTGHNLRSWYLWFVALFFMFFQFGTFFGLIFLPFSRDFVDYQTTFTNFISDDAIYRSYIISGLCISMVAALAAYIPKPPASTSFSQNVGLYQFGQFLMILTLPFVLANLLFELNVIRVYGYGFIYTAEYEKLKSPIPFIGIISNLNRVAFFTLFASVLNKKKFIVVAILFLMVAGVDAVKGARSSLIVPAVFLYWYYNFHFPAKISLSKKAIFGIFTIVFLFVMQLSRAEQAVDFSLLFRFMITALSKAQHTLAVYIDNIADIEFDGVFLLSPVTFPYKYMLYGSQLTGHSVNTPLLRGSLDHILSSSLNLDAYLSGAGMGSNFAAEAVQFGPVWMAAIIIGWAIFYTKVFSYCYNYRMIYFLNPYIFMHLILSPRATMLVPLWPLIKFSVIVAVLLLAYKLMRIKR